MIPEIDSHGVTLIRAQGQKKKKKRKVNADSNSDSGTELLRQVERKLSR